MSGPQIGKFGMNLDIPLGARLQWAPHDSNAPLKQTIICGSTVVPIDKRIKDGWAIGKTKGVESYVIVKPNAYPYFILEEYPGELRLLVFSGPDLEPQPILQELTRTGDRRQVLVTLKELAKNDHPVPMIEVDLIDLANKFAEGKLKL